MELFIVGVPVVAYEQCLNWTEWNKPEQAAKGVFTGTLSVISEEEIIQLSINDRMGEKINAQIYSRIF